MTRIWLYREITWGGFLEWYLKIYEKYKFSYHDWRQGRINIFSVELRFLFSGFSLKQNLR